ncbi:two-component response regulator ORR22-like isoform X2 [Zingiber officinale]|uniref:two-component response regulator ORR22-like isoform X2 n=1 Tax=Zingiber officinale TaxID=94328 RepID=UPI001C4AFF2E|nr:two-component response regulator ORR22-like isoform X2 [Zingiber officinale]
MGRDGGQNEQFPVGMRVLAVDDDPTCLKVLEAMLLRCRYNVTTTNKATSALKLLREKREYFDLVISDVHMPDMDGFRLLELVGLEMDLPVIMLSVNGETKTVMKGITHGACDYLLKPVRIEELKNIWQHVVRRRKLAHKKYSHFDDGEESDKHQIVSKEAGDGLNPNGLPNQNEKFSRKRKDQNEEDEDNCEENMLENEDSTTQKKQRVVWSMDLHRKFVAAVNQMGIDKAVPKRILELMNVEKLTRENVASHLQKYRLYLRRLSAAASRQVNMVAAFGGRDSYISSLDDFGTFQTLGASGKLQAIRSLQSSEVLVNANTSGLGLHDRFSSSIIQVGNSNTNIPPADISRLQPIILPSNQYGRLVQGVPTSLELQQLQLNRIHKPISHFPGSLSGSRISIPNNSFSNVTNSDFIAQSPEQQTPSRTLANLSSSTSLSTSLDPSLVSVGFSSELADASRCKADLQSAVPLTPYTTSTPSIVSFTNNENLPNFLDNFPVAQRGSSSQSISSTSTIVSPSQDPFIGKDAKCHKSSSGGPSMLSLTTMDEERNFLNFSNASNSKQIEPEEEHIYEQEALFNSFSSTANLVTNSVSGNQRVNNSLHNPGYSICSPSCQIDKSDNNSSQKDKLNWEIMKVQGGSVLFDCFLDDAVGSLIKPEKDHISFAENSESDMYPLDACL